MPGKSHKMPDGTIMKGPMPKQPVKGGLTEKQKKNLPPALQEAILKKRKK